MFIHWLEFDNYTTGQKIERINFDRLNLLVGVSGAGKTQILKTLSQYVDAVVKGTPIPYAGCFSMGFSIDVTQEIIHDTFRSDLTWKIETRKPTYNNNGESSHEISNESLTASDGTVVFEKNDRDFFIEGKEMPGIASEKSILHLFSAPFVLSEIRFNFSKVASYFRQIAGLNGVPNEYAKNQIEQWESEQLGQRPLAEVKFRLSQYPTLLGISLAKRFVPSLYQEFLEALQASFPYVDEILVSDKKGTGTSELVIWQDDTWIEKRDISGGMLKAIYVLANSCFSPDGSVILLDELENALGVNCLDDIVDTICVKSAENHQQFILTSHHPYIINNIPVEDWRIISQNHGIIEAKSVNEANIDTQFNRQEAFFQLINYLQGQTA